MLSDDDWTPKNAEGAFLMEAFIELGAALFVASIAGLIAYCLAGL